MIKELSKEKFEEKYPEKMIHGLEMNSPVYLDNGMILIDSEWNGEVYTIKTKDGEHIIKPIYEQVGDDFEIIGYED